MSDAVRIIVLHNIVPKRLRGENDLVVVPQGDTVLGALRRTRSLQQARRAATQQKTPPSDNQKATR